MKNPILNATAVLAVSALLATVSVSLLGCARKDVAQSEPPAGTTQEDDRGQFVINKAGKKVYLLSGGVDGNLASIKVIDGCRMLYMTGVIWNKGDFETTTATQIIVTDSDVSYC